MDLYSDIIYTYLIIALDQEWRMVGTKLRSELFNELECVPLRVAGHSRLRPKQQANCTHNYRVTIWLVTKVLPHR